MSDLTIRQAQSDLWANKLSKGFNTTDVSLEFNLLTEEVGEAIKAWRHGDGLAGELADVALYVMALAEMNGIDLGLATAEKMAVNRAREYTRSDSGAWIKVEGSAGGVPAPDSVEYERDKLQGAFILMERSRNLWKSRAESAGWRPESARGIGPVAESAGGAQPTCHDTTHDHSTSSCLGPRAGGTACAGMPACRPERKCGAVRHHWESTGGIKGCAACGSTDPAMRNYAGGYPCDDPGRFHAGDTSLAAGDYACSEQHKHVWQAKRCVAGDTSLTRCDPLGLSEPHECRYDWKPSAGDTDG